MKQQIVACALCGILALGITGCGSSKRSSSAKSDGGQEQAGQEVTAEEEAPEKDLLNLAVGESAEFGDGLTVSVNSVQTGLENYDGSFVTCINVTYVNNSSGSESFNIYDWKGEDANGAQRSTTFYTNGENELNSGTLSSGGSVTGNIYFEDGTVRVHYYSNVFNDEASAIWTL